MSLVDVVDEVLALLEGDERMRFTLDGQMAPLDDYLEIRPEREEQIRRFVEKGQLAVGPWQTLPDEFLVSGESLFRNLEVGLERASQFGRPMLVGYIPDSFGHIAQMPQILRTFGIARAALWRGVPSEITTHSFLWEAPDGSNVSAQYLPEDGYSNAAYAFGGKDTPEIVEERLRPWFGDDPMLGMVGTDHMPPVRDLPDRIPADAHVATLTEYFEAIDGTTPPVGWHGELRSASRANLLPNVVSARIDIKQACARAERALERYGEPLQALYGDEWPEQFLRIAWSRLLQNSAHDSICGCSTDEVSAQVLVRYAEAEQIGTELALRAVQRIAVDTPGDCTVVVNPSPFRRREIVELPDGALAHVEAPALGWTTARAPEQNPVPGTEPPVAFDLSTLRIVDGGDYGDSYTYAPPPTDRLVDDPVETSTDVVEDGPLRRRAVERRVYEWPRGLNGTRRSDDVERVEVTLTAETRTGEPFVRLRIELDNPCDDHRVRVHVPLPEPADTTRAEGQFAIVERPRLQEAGFGEDGLGAYPASGFVSAGGIALLFEHVSEYELVGDRELAVTVLRSTGLISRADNPYRPVNAGPEVPIPDAQMRKPHVFSFAWCPDVGNAVVHAEAYRHPFLTAPGGTGDRREQSGPEFPGLVLSSLRRRDGKLVARVANESDEPVGDLRPWEIRELTLEG